MKKLCLIALFITSVPFFTLCTAQNTDIHDFFGSPLDGANPTSQNLTLSGKVLYGMTNRGGYYNNEQGCIFSVDTDGNNYKIILNFNDTNGAFPNGSLILSGKRLYGMTIGGGPYGNIFSIDTDGSSFKNLLYFNDTNGATPYGSLIIAGNRLYGMAGGGAHNGGCIFAIDTNGNNYKKLFDFTEPNGIGPQGSLILNGKVLYGVTGLGGTYNDGVIFSIDTDGTHYKKLLDFDSANGKYPLGSLTLSLSGKVLYGMTEVGGAHNLGCIFSIDTDGSSYKDIYDFINILNAIIGKPRGSLTLVGKALYGATPGVAGNLGFYNGNIFSIDTDGSNFTNRLYFGEGWGANPFGSLTYASGELYGMTYDGGVYNKGIIFKLDTGAVSTLSINSLTENAGELKVYPNPNNGIFILQINSQQPVNNNYIQVYDVLGQQVYQSSVNTNNMQINVSGQSQGLYFYRVVTETGELVGEGKIVLQR